MDLPTLDMADWSILDYELAFDGIRHVNDATVWLQNQPRSKNSATHDYHRGADFIVSIGEGWCSTVLDDLMQSLRVIRFPDPKHDERRILLLLSYESSWGPSAEPLAKILAAAMQRGTQSVAQG